MTQGTKVGLLVSLAFLIVILVLLSDHVATTSDARPSQQVTLAGPQVAQGITTPGPQAMPAPELVANSAEIAPAQPVPIVQEFARQAPPPQIDIGPSQRGELEIRAANNNVPVNVRVAPVQVGPGASVVSLADAARSADPTLATNFVPANPATPGQTPTVAPVANVPPTQVAISTPVAPKSFEHKARPGDTVSKMARKYYGLDTKSNRDLIVAANKSLKANPNRIEVGQSYIIPVKPGSISAAQAAAAPIAAAIASPMIAPTATGPATPVAPVVEAAKPEPAERVYVVKSGDNLWKIAKEQCKDVNAVNQLKKLNADVLKNGIDLKVGTKLRLPAAKE